MEIKVLKPGEMLAARWRIAAKAEGMSYRAVKRQQLRNNPDLRPKRWYEKQTLKNGINIHE